MVSPVIVAVMALIALGIRVISWGPVFYKQERIGFGGKPFLCWKFRSMRQNTGTTCHQEYVQGLVKEGGPMTKMDDLGDPRLIPLGALLRATGLDELPQVFNVLRGDMSLVGPRPCIPKEFECYSEYAKQRCNALPGLTGLWQVSGKNRTTFSQMIELDLRYIKEQSLWLDITIMFKTIPVLLVQTVEMVRKRLADSRDLARSLSQ